MNLEAAGCTDKGRVRGNNEDAFRCCTEQGVFVLCDGMGGAAGGEIASQMGADCVANSLCGENCGSLVGDAAEAAILQAIAEVNREIYEWALREPCHQGMGTTIVVALLSEETAHLAHVGDSRCYLWRNGKLEQQTQDHSLVSEQVRMGRLSPEEAERSPYRHVITRALGTEAFVPVEYQRLAVAVGDVLLLCSDGLTNELRDDAIAAIVARAAAGEELDAVCRALVDEANEAGGRDNTTCVLVRV